MTSKLILRSRLEHLEYAKRVLEARLTPLREHAQQVDNYNPENNTFDLKPPIHYSSVEALVMDVSDLAQAVGYLDSLIHQECS